MNRDDTRLIAFDLDGTLLTEKKVLTSRTRDVLERAAACGITLVTTTGRSLAGIPDAVKVLPGAHYAITANGAGVYRRIDESKWQLPDDAVQGLPTYELDPETGYELLFENLMDVPRGIALMRELGELAIMPDPFIGGKSYIREDKAYLIDQMDVTGEMKAYIRASRIPVPDMESFLSDKKMQKITINFACGSDGHRIDLNPAQEILKKYPEFVAVTGGIRNIEVSDIHATKGDALMTLANRLGIRAEQIIAFGDSENDNTMLDFAGTGVAMANSLEDTLNTANVVTLSNDEEGVADYLEKLF